jgi:hypothetical protein
MVKPTPPTAPEAPLRSDAAFSAKAQTFLTWLSGVFYSYVGAAVDFVDARADEALAAATTFGFPSIAGRALNFTRVNAAGSALEFLTAEQVSGAIGFAKTTGLPRRLDVPGNMRFQGNTANTGAGASLAITFPFAYATGTTPLILLVPIASAGVSLSLTTVGNTGFTIGSWASNSVSAPNVNIQWFAWGEI